MTKLTPLDKAALWHLGGFGCLALWFFTFFTWIVWLMAMTPHDARIRFPDKAIDPNWRAVISDHGKPAEWKRGPIEDDVPGFWLNVALSAVGFAGFVYCQKRVKQAQRSI